MTIDELNALSTDAAVAELRKCCGATAWTKRMAATRPFVSLNELCSAADRIWLSLDSEDWLEAFRSHPKIGEQKAAAATSEQSKRWSEGEQAGVAQAARSTLQELAELNQEYLEKFGYIFIVCATGKTSEEMLAMLRTRLNNEPAEELKIAAGEQAKITQLRLRKLFEE